MHTLPTNTPLERSVWLATAREKPLNAPSAPDAHARVAIVGAGYTGLSTALHLAQKGVDVIVLEKGQVGAGASGVNGGQVIPGLKRDPDVIEKMFPGPGKDMVRVFGKAADLVFSVIEQYGIDCSPSRSGWILAAHAPQAMGMIRQRHAQWAARGADVDLLSSKDLERLSGSGAYAGGLIDHRAGTLQPLDYVRGLARTCRTLGVQVFEQSNVENLSKRGADWCLQGQGFDVRAQHVVIATDAYSGPLLPALERSLLNVSSLQIATNTIPDEYQNKFLPCLAGMSETRKLAVYLRRSPCGRLLIGGRGANRAYTSPTRYRELQAQLIKIFPEAKHLDIEFCWHGKVGLTVDELPHIHEPAEHLLVALGYNGRGIAAATTMGKIIAHKIAGGELAGVLPPSKLTRIPWKFVRLPLMTAAISYYRIRDQFGFGS